MAYVRLYPKRHFVDEASDKIDLRGAVECVRRIRSIVLEATVTRHSVPVASVPLCADYRRALLRIALLR